MYNKFELFIVDTFLFVSANDLKILKFIVSENLKKSLIVHICILGVLYHLVGNVLVTGIVPRINKFNLTFQWPKCGIVTIAVFPTLKSSLMTISGFIKACKVCPELRNQKIYLEIVLDQIQHHLQ